VGETLIESELFGHVKGAFTDARTDRPGKFETAGGGSLFLDEIGNLPLHLQAKLLAALQSRSIVRLGSNTPIPVDIRLMSATNKHLSGMVDKGLFREDLLYRINTIHVEIPPLRERPDDILPLARLFLARYAARYGKQAASLSAAAGEKLKNQPWPGNIRELQHTIEKAVIMSERHTLEANHFHFSPKKETPQPEQTGTLEEMEYNMIKNTMDKYGGNLSLVAARLGISRQTLYNKLKRYEL
jgi:transcriptional regulator with PAS, ATPase and Fis domain